MDLDAGVFECSGVESFEVRAVPIDDLGGEFDDFYGGLWGGSFESGGEGEAEAEAADE